MYFTSGRYRKKRNTHFTIYLFARIGSLSPNVAKNHKLRKCTNFHRKKSFVMSKRNDTCCKYEHQSKPVKSDVVSKLEIPVPMQPAPHWSGVAIKDARIVNISLDDYSGKYLVFIFYPYDFNVVCPSELMQFSDRVAEFKNLDCEVVTVSTDSEYTHLAWSTTPKKQGGLGGMRIAMLSDKSHRISKDYGVFDENEGVSYRALFVVDDKQNLRHVTINDIAIPRSVDEVLRVIEACQFADKHGNVCPMGPREQIQLEDTGIFEVDVPF